MIKLKYVYIGIGTNLGDKQENINNSINKIKATIGSNVLCSKIYKTPPWGFKAEDDFYNCVIKVQTTLNPIQLLDKLKTIELVMGRDLLKNKGYQSRIIDLDIIDFNNEVHFSNTLCIPHSLLTERKFVLQPLFDVNDKWIHPISKIPIKELILNLPDSSIEVVKN